MALSMDWGTKVITVLQADLNVVGGTLYELDTDWFRLQLKALEESPAGIVMPATHEHNTQVSLGSAVFARVIKMINGYTVTFEETGSPYTVSLVGSNNNVASVTNLGTVQIIVNNSAGLIVTDTGGGGTGSFTQTDRDQLNAIPTDGFTQPDRDRLEEVPTTDDILDSLL